MKQFKTLLVLACVTVRLSAAADTGTLAAVVTKPLSRTMDLPGDLAPYLSVSLHAKVQGFVERVLVDRGSMVKQGDLLVEASAPEMKAQIAEAESKVLAVESEKVQAEAQLAAAQSTADRLKKAAETPGAVAGNELILAQKQVEAAQALVRSREQASRAAESSVRSQKDMQAYLRITAPFDGVITDRFVHPGALIGPGAGMALLVLQQVSRLRLVVPVPEAVVGEMVKGGSVPFHVPAYPERTFSGTIARVSHNLDPKTRTMAVELDVANRDGALSPGMYTSVKWPVRGSRTALFVPKTSVVTTTERTFVIRDKEGHAEWVDVTKGVADGDLVQVMGNLAPGDKVVRLGTDELRDGATLQAKAK